MSNLPIGIHDFGLVNDTYYVDKTLIIKELIDSYIGKSILITRPRRFGKTLTLSMIDYYFNIIKDSKSIFKDKLIARENAKYFEYLNNYPIIHINMKNLTAELGKSLIDQTIELISRIYRENQFLLKDECLLDVEKQDILKVINKEYKDNYTYTNSLSNLSYYLEKYYKRKVIILIDEYDTPLDIAFQNNFYKDVILFYKKLYSSALKDNSSLLFSIVSGVLEVAKESIFSDLNNLNVLSVLNNKFASYFGFTEEEVKKMLVDFDSKLELDEIRKWYGGYGTNEVEIFNPWSVLNVISNDIYDQYWVNTGSNNVVSSLIKQIPNAESLLNETINNKTKLFKISNSITYKDVGNNFNALVSFLVQSGYLRAKLVDKYSNYYLVIPNEEILYTFEREILSRNLNEDHFNLAMKLKEAIISVDNNMIITILKDYVLSSYSYYDLNTEKEYQVMLVGIFAVLFDDYIVKSEVNTPKGRCDIMIQSKKDNDIGIVIEIKKYKGKLSVDRKKQFANSALAQINKGEYYNELKKTEIKKILLYGFVFDDTGVEIVSREYAD